MTPPIARSQWGARYPDGFGPRPMPITEYWLHHSVTMAPDLVAPFTDDDAAIRRLEQIGQERFGGGISYTYPVTPTGRLYTGHSLNRRGAHTKGHNTIAAAFCLVGDYSRRTVTTAQRDTIAAQMVADHRAGRSTTHRLKGGHRDVSQTACPGDSGYAAIPDINRRADRLWSGTNTEEDDMALTPAEQDAFAQKIADKVLWSPAIPGHAGLMGSSVRNNIGVTAGTAQAIQTQLVALTQAVETLAVSKGADPEAIAAEVAAAVRDRLAQITVIDGAA